MNFSGRDITISIIKNICVRICLCPYVHNLVRISLILGIAIIYMSVYLLNKPEIDQSIDLDTTAARHWSRKS